MTRTHSRVFYGWWVVSTAALGLLWGPPITVSSFSVFLKPLMQNFHAPRCRSQTGGPRVRIRNNFQQFYVRSIRRGEEDECFNR